MPVYQYTAKNVSGEVVTGKLTSENQQELKKSLYDKGLFLTKSKEQGSGLSLDKIFNRVKLKEFVIFCRQFSVILGAGLTVVEGVSIMSDQTESKKLREVLLDVHEQLLKGSVFSEALKAHSDVFPEFFINMIQVGEASGSLELILDRLAEYYEKENKMRKKVKGALTYPIVVIIVAIGVISLLILKVLPMFADMLSGMGGELPLLTKIMMNISNFMAKNFLLLTLVNVSVVGGLAYYFTTEDGRYKWDAIKLNAPLIKKLTVKVVTSKFARSMGILLKSGIPIMNAMDIMTGLVGNKIIEEKFKGCSEEVRGGKGISKPLKNMNIFPPMLIHMVSVGENTGELDDMLTRTAVFFDEEVEETVEQLTTLIEPIMIIVLGSIVAVIILAVMLPMVSVMQNIQ
ncbi:type II secretion system F family protein [Hathewaya histolytica]|uniref:type II secretion system F family protein n=1 Tax=Hathewaya histolytica TaxID=1498 RepID=UPI0039ECC381